MFETGLDNELLALDSGLENSAMAAEGDAGEQIQYVPDGFTTDQDGNFVNADGERVYYWAEPAELGTPISRNPNKELFRDTGGYYTEAQIRSAWNADQGMGYLKEQIDWDNYWSYLTERQALIQDGTLYDATYARQAGRDNRQEFLQDNGGLREMGGAKDGRGAMQQLQREGYNDYYTEFLSQPEQVALMAKYGISPVFENNDGDVFGWNGSSYTKVAKVDDHNYGAIVGQLIKSFVVTALTAGLSQAAVGYLATMPGTIGNVFNAVNNFVFGVPPGGSSIAQQTMSNYNRDLIVNFVDEAVNNLDAYSNSIVADEYLDELGKPDDKSEYTIYGVYGDMLPPGYIYDPDRNVVVNQETGEEYQTASSPWGTRVWLPTPEEEDDPSGGAGTSSAGSAGSNSGGTNTTTPTTTTTSGTGGRRGDDGSYPGVILTNEVYGDIRIDDRDVWSENNEYAGWVLVSNTGVWGQSGISVIYNPNTGFYQEIDWDNGTYNQQMGNSKGEDQNPFGENGEPGATNTGSTTGGGTTTTPTPAKEGDVCDLPDGTKGVIKDGKCALPTAPNLPLPTYDPNATTTSSNSNTTSGGTNTVGGTNANTSTNTTTSTSTTTNSGTTTGTTITTTPGPGIDVTGVDIWGGQGVGSGTGTGTGTSGSGSGTGSGDGTGDGNGNGNGNGSGGGALDLTGRGAWEGSKHTKLAGHVFVPYKPQTGKVRGLSYEPKSNDRIRQDVINSLWTDLLG